MEIELSLEECSKILDKRERKYSEEEVKKIRGFLTRIAKEQVEAFKKKTKIKSNTRCI